MFCKEINNLEEKRTYNGKMPRKIKVEKKFTQKKNNKNYELG